jgi:serine phosphatase RsbU (regulator of sigma subunit)/Tfp pilus assembly protein PilF
VKHIIYILLFLISFQGITQTYSPEEQHKIDSLNSIINDPNSHDTLLASTYLDLSGILYVSNLDTMIPICNKIIYIVDKNLLKNPPEKTRNRFLASLSGAYNNIGFVYWSKGNVDKALYYLNLSLEHIESQGDKKGLATGLNNIGSIYNNQGNISKALEYYHKSLLLEEELGNKIGIATTLNNIAGVYNEQGDTKKALDYFKKSLYLLEKLKNKKGIGSVHNSMGSIYDSEGNFKKALEYYFIALALQKEIGNKNGKADCLNNIGYTYFNMGETDNSLIYYYKSLELREEIGDKEGIAGSSLGIAKAVLQKGNVDLAKRYAIQGLRIANEIGYPRDIKTAAKILSEIYEKDNNSKESLSMLKLFITMNDSINNEETKLATSKQQAKYEYEKQKLIDDSEHDKLITIEKKEKQKQKITIYAIVGGLLLVLIFLLFVFNRLKITRKQRDLIESQKEIVEVAHSELEEKNQEILDSIIYAQRIQSAILPPKSELNRYLKNGFVLYKPKDIVAGDFYWLEAVGDVVYFAAADCTGHGVPGAMVSVVCHGALNRSIREFKLTEPAKILDKARELVIETFNAGRDNTKNEMENIKDGMDIALCAINYKTNKLNFSGANNSLYIIKNGDLKEIKGNKQPIGRYVTSEPFTNHEIILSKNDTIYIFTDGFVDQFGGPKGKKFMYKPFRKLLLSVQGKSMDEQQTILAEAFGKWKGDIEQVDDVCVIGVRI